MAGPQNAAAVHGERYIGSSKSPYCLLELERTPKKNEIACVGGGNKTDHISNTRASIREAGTSEETLEKP